MRSHSGKFSWGTDLFSSFPYLTSMSWVLLLLYTLIIFYSIYKLKFFQLEGLGKWTPSLFFLLKIIAGIALWLVYTYYYTDRSTSDIWKYFDDGKVMFGALHS